MSINREKLVDSLGDSIGIAKAKDVIDDAAASAGVNASGALAKDEAYAILNEIAEDDSTGTMVTVAANATMTRLRT